MGGMVSSLTATKKTLPILMVGRGFAGKSTILYRLIHGEFIEINTPTIGFDVNTVDYKDVSFNVSEVGGQLRGMTLVWKHYFETAPGLIVVVDSNDRERIIDAKAELHYYMKEIEVIGKKANILVYANKQDLPNAMSVTEISDKLDIHSLRQHNWHVQTSCAVTGEGLHDGLEWLHRHLFIKA